MWDNKRRKWIGIPWGLILLLAFPLMAQADEMLALYGLKGYAYTYSPLPADGLYLQTGGVHSQASDPVDGFICALPVSLTYGDGKWWEVAVASHYEHWENTDLDIEEDGWGDLFLGGKFRLSGDRAENPLDLSLMPYALIPTGARDQSIGDLYPLNPSNEDDLSYGLNLLLGRRWDRLYLTANLGIHFVDTDLDIDRSSWLVGLAAEFQVNESLNLYAEFVNNENKRPSCCDPCADAYPDENRREIGAGAVWLWGKWGMKLHAGAGLSDTAPDFRAIFLINRELSRDKGGG